MKLLAVLGSIAIFVYIMGLILLSVMNVSRAMFDKYIQENEGFGFLARQGMVFIWPLALFSNSGQKAFKLIWFGEI
jgi:hypothetical protein